MVIAIVPAYNEALTIGSVVRDLSGQVDRVVVVDDGSSDATATTAAAAGAVVLRHAVNRGQGAALETGHSYARKVGADYVVHFDADGQFDAADIPGALALLQGGGKDILFGSRFLDGRSRMPWTKRVIFLPLLRLFERLSVGMTLTDAHNGFRVLSARALRAIRLTQDRMAHATEIVSLSRRHGLAVVEYPVKVLYREYGQGVRGGFRVLVDLFFARWLK